MLPDRCKACLFPNGPIGGKSVFSGTEPGGVGKIRGKRCSPRGRGDCFLLTKKLTNCRMTLPAKGREYYTIVRKDMERMKKSICKKISALLCVAVLMMATVLPVWAEGDISVQSPPVTDGKYCSSCGLNSMVATGTGRSTITTITVSSCAYTNGVTIPHAHDITTFYATYVCSNCGNWGEIVTSTHVLCKAV